MKYFLILILVLLISGCAHINKEGNTFYGWGYVKRDAEGNILEIKSEAPIKFPSFGISK